MEEDEINGTFGVHGEMQTAYKVAIKSDGKAPLGRYTCRWKDI
jgi:hypothetical protein